MKLDITQSNIINLEIEPGETLRVNFSSKNSDPNTLMRGLTIGTKILPRGIIALGLYTDENNLYIAKPLAGQHPTLVILQDMGADKLEFVENEEAPRIALKLSRADLFRLLNEDK